MEKVECNVCGKKFDTTQSLQQHKKDAHETQKVESTPSLPKKSNVKKIILYVAVFLVFAAIAYGVYSLFSSPTASIGPIGSTHEHVDFKVYINGETIDFSQSKYQLRSGYVHVEGGEGDLVHKHATGVTMAYFLNTLGIKLTNDCITVNNIDYCNTVSSNIQEIKTLKMYVNGQPLQSNQFTAYELHDLDKVLISYGNESSEQIQQQLNSITDSARQSSMR